MPLARRTAAATPCRRRYDLLHLRFRAGMNRFISIAATREVTTSLMR